MPKMKTHQGAAGASRRAEGTRWRAGHNHMLEKKGRKQKRRLNTETDLTRSTRRRSSDSGKR